MAEIPIDLSGVSGLANGHAGDADIVTPQPNLRAANDRGQMVSGLFNPHLRKGYLAPTTTTSVAVTTNVAPNSRFVASEYDNVSDTVYWADENNKIYTADGLNDVTLSQGIVLEDTSTVGTYPDRKYAKLHDLQMYQLNGERALYFVGEGLMYKEREDEQIATQASADEYVIASISVNASGTTTPSIVGNARSYFVAAGNENTSYSLVGGTDTCLWVVVFIDDASEIPGVTWRDVSGTPSYTMTQIASGNIGSSRYYVFNLPNPPSVTTGAVRTTVTLSGFDRLVYVFETNNTNQTNPGEVDFNVKTTNATTSVAYDIQPVSRYQLSVFAGFGTGSTAPTFLSEYSDNEIYRQTNGYGWDFLTYLGSSFSYGLLVGIKKPDLTDIIVWGDTWSASLASGRFVQQLDGEYAFMRNADNGFAYVFAKNAVHKIDGNTTGGENGAITKNVLLFPDYFRIADAVDYRSRLYIAVHQFPADSIDTDLRNYTAKCGIYVWNRISLQLSSGDYIELPGVREIKKIYASPDGVLKIIVISENGLTELRQFGYNDSGGVVFPVMLELGIGAYPQLPDGLTTAGDKVLWLANDGRLYCDKMNSVVQLYEAKAPGATSSTLAVNINSGAILYGSGTETADSGYRSNKQGVYLSYNDGSITNEKIYPFDIKTGANANQTPNAGNVYTGVTYLPVTSIVRRIRIYNAPVTSTGDTVIATVKIYFNQSPTVSMTKSVTLNEAKRGYVDFNISKSYVHAVQIEVEWSTGTPIGPDMYLPSVAIISTEETGVATPDSE